MLRDRFRLPEGRGPGVEGQTPAAGGERAWCVGGLRKTGVCDMKVLSRKME